MIRVRFAVEQDQRQLIEFIHDHWSSSHIFTERPDLFVWQHLQSDGRLNMVLAEDDQSVDPIIGILGFIPLGRFDPHLGDRDLMLAIWKVRDVGVPPGVGLRLLKFLQAQLEPRLIAAIGTSQMVRPIYRALRYEVGKLEQAALFHPDRLDELVIADSVPPEAFVDPVSSADGTIELVPFASARLPEIDEIALGIAPVKSIEYVVARFMQHPWYDYDVRVVMMADAPVAIVVWRCVTVKGTRVLRVVDMIGSTDWISFAGEALRAEVIAADAEYLDVMYWGVENDLFRSAGFVTRADHPEMVLPNYFEPFERRNVDIELAYRIFDGDDWSVRLFRADSDQDRPNQVGETDGVR